MKTHSPIIASDIESLTLKSAFVGEAKRKIFAGDLQGKRGYPGILRISPAENPESAVRGHHQLAAWADGL